MLPDSDSGRLLICFWWFFITASSTMYCGNLVAFLTFPEIEPQITSIEHMMSDSGAAEDATWGMLNGR